MFTHVSFWKMGFIWCSETSVADYKPTSRNIPEERKPDVYVSSLNLLLLLLLLLLVVVVVVVVAAAAAVKIKAGSRHRRQAEVYFYAHSTVRQEEVIGQRHAPRRFTPGKETHCTGGWVGLWAGVDKYEKSRSHRGSNPGPSSP